MPDWPAGEDDPVDFAVAAFCAAGEWSVHELTREHLVDVETLAEALRHLPGSDDIGAIAMVSVDEDFFVVVRALPLTTRVLLSDVTAAEEWELAHSALVFLGLDSPEDDDDGEPEPAGDLDLLADLGVTGDELDDLLDDPDSYPDEVLSDVARLIGFGPQFDLAVGLAPA